MSIISFRTKANIEQSDREKPINQCFLYFPLLQERIEISVDGAQEEESTSPAPLVDLLDKQVHYPLEVTAQLSLFDSRRSS